MRLAAQGKDPLDGQRHMCGMGNVFHYHSTGFPELDEIMRTPQPLIFIMELISVGSHRAKKTSKYIHAPSHNNTFILVPLLHHQEISHCNPNSVTECYTIKCYTAGKKCCSQFSDRVFNPQPSETSTLQFSVFLRWATRSLTSASLG